MNYPVTANDFDDITVDDDEQATLIVIEACLSDSFETLDFKEGVNVGEVHARVVSWDRYNEYAALVSAQKALLTRTLAGSAQNAEPVDSDFALSQSIAANVSASMKKERSKNAKMRTVLALSTAACLVLVVSIFALTNNNSDSHITQTAQRAPLTNAQPSTTAANDQGANAPQAIDKVKSDTAAQYQTTAITAFDLGTFHSEKDLVKHMKSSSFSPQFSQAQSSDFAGYNATSYFASSKCSDIKQAVASALVFTAKVGSSHDRVFAYTQTPGEHRVAFTVVSDCKAIDSFDVSS